MSPELITKLSQPEILVGIVSALLTLLGLPLMFVFYILPRRLRITAVARPPWCYIDSRRPFTLTVTNKNTRQVKIEKIGFETFMRPLGYFEYSYSANLLKTDKLLVSEGDLTEVAFDVHKLADDMGRSLAAQTSTYQPRELKVWLYLTHGSRITVDVDSKLEEQIRSAIAAAVASTAGNRES
ncbi:hypothetical protein ABT364_18775 [Massilia sp. SR12]